MTPLSPVLKGFQSSFLAYEKLKDLVSLPKMAATALHASIFPLPQSPYLNSPLKIVPFSFKANLQNPNAQRILLSPLSITKNHLALVAINPKKSKLHCSPAQGTTLEAELEQNQVRNNKRKLYVSNWPWTYSVEDLTELFGQCGTVTDIEFMKNKDGKGRNFGFVTMATGEEAQAVVDKFDSYEVADRIIKVEFAKRFDKYTPKTFTREVETEHQLFVSNLNWKVRATHLRKFFNESIKPVSSKVIFVSRRSAGYGFVSFATREEAETALSTFNGKELMGRPVILKLNDKKIDDIKSESREEDNCETHAYTVSEIQEENNSETEAEEQ